jgi:dTDP-glucose 4,6-dehydratase
LNNRNLPIYGKGKNSREWIYVKDHCEALLLIYLKGRFSESYNIGTGQNFKNIDIANRLLRIAKKKSIKIGKKVKIKYVKDRPGHDFRYALNRNKILKKLRWKAKTSLSFGLLKTFDWYKNNLSFFSNKSIRQFDKRLGLKL